MQKVFQKQEGMEEMFYRRQASLKKLAAKQTRPVQPVAPRPEALTKSPCPSPGMCVAVLPGHGGPLSIKFYRHAAGVCHPPAAKGLFPDSSLCPSLSSSVLLPK